MMAAPAPAMGVSLRLLAEAADGSAAQVIPDHVVGDYRDLDTLRAFAAGLRRRHVRPRARPDRAPGALEAEGIAVHPAPAPSSTRRTSWRCGAAHRAAGCPVPGVRRVVDDADVEAFAADARLAGRGEDRPRRLRRQGRVDGRRPEIRRGRGDREPARRRGRRCWPRSASTSSASCRALGRASPVGPGRRVPGRRDRPARRDLLEVIAPAPGLDEDLAVAAQEDRAQGRRRARASPGCWPSSSSRSRPDGPRLLVNELAMRPHNSGHWSIDGAVTSQFENHLRAVLDLPLGSTRRRARRGR